MFTDTVDSLVSSIQGKADKLVALAARKTAKANKHSELAIAAQSEAERAHRVSKKIAALLS